MARADFDYPAAVQFECTRCAICCGDTLKKVRHVLLLSPEARLIAAETSQKISDFAVKIRGRAPYSYEMKKTKDGKCVFLEKCHCCIYSLRPLVCRFYPFELKTMVEEKQAFLFTDECPGLGRGKKLRKSHFRKLFQLAQAKMGAE